MSTTTSDEEGAPPQAPAGVNPPEEPFPAEKKDGAKEKVVKRQLAFESRKGEKKSDSDATAAAESAKPKASPKLQKLKARAAARRESAKTELARPSTAPVRGRTETELRTRVDQLTDTLRETEKAKEEAVAEIKSLTKKHKEIEETTIKHYESIINSLESEVKTLGVKVEEAESLTLRQKILSTEDSKEISLNESEYGALRKEIEEQEILLKGYQSENESAILKLKQMKEEMREKEEKMAEEHATYARDLIVLQEERRVDSQKTASWLREKLELQKQANGLKEELYQTERKYKTEIERHKREKQELEARAAGVDLKQIEKEEELVRSVKAEMENMKKEHAIVQAELESKLKWYTENQEFVNQNSELIKEQVETIAALRKRLAKFEGEGSDKGPEVRMATRITELEDEVKHLNGLLVKNNPDSLSALIAATKPSVEEAAMVKELQTEVEMQKKKNAELMRKHESQLRSLRQQHEKARIQEREAKQTGRVKELNKQLEDVRSHYTKKVKTLEKSLQSIKKEKVHYQESLREERRQSRKMSESSANSETSQKDLAMIQALKIELEQARDEREQMRRELRQSKDALPVQSDAVHRLEMQVQDLTARLGGLSGQGTVPAPLQAQPQPAQGMYAAPSHPFAPKENAAADANAINRMRQLESELAYLRGDRGHTHLHPMVKSSYSPEYIVLEEKLAQMDARQIAREEQWRAVMEETKHLASLQQNVLNQKWELAIRAKNAEIDRFRTELDAILFDVSNLQRRGQA